jgi:hypothetical protein
MTNSIYTRAFRRSLLAGLLLVLLGVPAASAQTHSDRRPLLSGSSARHLIATEEPEAEIKWCHRKAANHIRCLVNVFIITQGELIDEATGAVIEAAHPVSRTPVPMWVDIGQRGARWTLTEAPREE